MLLMPVGTFTAVTDSLVVCDPLLLHNKDCRLLVQDVLPGDWESSMLRSSRQEGGQYRVMCLLAVHRSCTDEGGSLLREIASGGQPEQFFAEEHAIWVDSGLCGIFDFGVCSRIAPASAGAAGAGTGTAAGRQSTSAAAAAPSSICEFVEDCRTATQAAGDTPAGTAAGGSGTVCSIGTAGCEEQQSSAFWCRVRRSGAGQADAMYLLF